MVIKDSPLSEITLRRYEKPGAIKDRDLVKKICLSLGLLQPGDSRDVIVDILLIFLKARKRKKMLSVDEIEQKVISSRKVYKVPMLGVASSNIRRQIKRLREAFLIEKVKTRYRLTEGLTLREIFDEKIEAYILHNALMRVRDYIAVADDRFA